MVILPAIRPKGAESRALFEDAPNISLSVHVGNDLKRGRLWPVHNSVIWIAGHRPETKETACEVGPGMAPHGSLRNQRASVVNRLFYTVSRVLVVIGDIGPN
jgi:hypothetical protein